MTVDTKTTLMPPAIAKLPRDKHGRPIPWFVYIDEDGVPDFRVVRRDGLSDAYRFDLCWVCGQQRGRHAAFVLGPMCAVNRTSAEPPSHLACALYSAQACPFLTTPNMIRRESNLPEHYDPGGIMLARNPGVALVWSSRSWKPVRVPNGVLFDIGSPTSTTWWAHGRPATREEVLASIETGLPALRELAETERNGVEALEYATAAAMELIPA
jgi:hypothetical protein